MGFSIDIDWHEEFKENYDKWDNRGRSLIVENCKHKTQDSGKDKETNMRYSGYCEECGYAEDSAEPMMNYAYPLETTPTDEAILKVLNNTNCTVMFNNEDDMYYLVLTGGGMDLSQDIAMAYHIIEKWVPFELALSVCTQPNISQYNSNFRTMMRACRDSIKNQIGHGQRKVKEITESISKSLKKND